ncbi:sugar ABC transporter substrate-binding protein [Paenibacillus sp. GCM10027626]|uniref:sugar ABC transporter substrate-binding protein n=1 Tax=Paenibacillus sp. GCM10027626 TaxID=3273411 RepID=UPI0036308529
MRKWLAIMLAAVMLIVAGCSKNAEQAKPSDTSGAEVQQGGDKAYDPKDHPLAIVMILKGHPVHNIVQIGFLEKAKELGYPAEILAGDDANSANAIAMGEAGILKGVRGMLVWAHEQSFFPFIKKASDSQIKVVVPHFPVAEGEAPGLDVNLTADPYKYGQDAAKAIAEKVGGKGTVAITQGSFNILENKAAEGFKKMMYDNYPDIKVLAPIEEGFDPAIAVGKAVGIIQSNNDLVGAFSTTGGGAATWAGAKDQTRKSDLICIGMDYTEQNIDLVKSGKIYGIVAQPLYEEAQESVVILDKLLRGEQLPYFKPLEAPVVTAEGIDKYAEIIMKVKEYFKK